MTADEFDRAGRTGAVPAFLLATQKNNRPCFPTVGCFFLREKGRSSAGSYFHIQTIR